MTPEEFNVAQVLASEGWEFTGTSDDGTMAFVRVVGGVLFVANVREDR